MGVIKMVIMVVIIVVVMVKLVIILSRKEISHCCVPNNNNYLRGHYIFLVYNEIIKSKNRLSPCVYRSSLDKRASMRWV